MSIESASEVDYQLELARDYDILPYDVWKRLAQEITEIRKMLTALRRAVLRSIEENESKDSPPASAESEGRSKRSQRKRNKRNQKKKPEETGPDA